VLKLVSILLLISSFAWGQRGNDDLDIADCYGGTFIDRPGDLTLQFTGRTGDKNDIKGFPSLTSKMTETNSLWASFVAPYDGLFLVKAFAPKGSMDFVVFKAENSDLCGAVESGGAEIERLLQVDPKDSFGLSKTPTPKNQYLYGISMQEGEEINLFFNNSVQERIKLFLNITFEGKGISEADIRKQVKPKDFRTDTTKTHLAVRLRDRSNGLPVSAQLIIEDSREKNGLYMGTDFLYSLGKRTNIKMKIDAPGYFFRDEELNLDGSRTEEVIIWLEPAAPGKKIELDGIQFNMGTSNFVGAAEQKLRRLKDFMTLNSEIHIEIQGHVHSVGENSFAGKRLSLARAKQVMDYLEENGIDKKRMEANGYGNEFMIYPEPKFTWQEQANRRVEIKIVQP
jgi:outer membrane protein OmpA-like peptidoglycan-associated protein